MTEYSDVPATNALYQEHETVLLAMNLLSKEGAGVTSLVVAGDPATAPGQGAMLNVPLPNIKELLDATQLWLVQRERELADQLAALGVTSTRRA